MPSGGCKIKKLFKLFAKNRSTGRAGVQGSPQPVPRTAPAAKGSCSGESLSAGQPRVPREPAALHRSLTSASPAKKGRLPTVGFADEHNVA